MAIVFRNRATYLAYAVVAAIWFSSLAAGEIHRTRTSRGAKAYPGSEQQTTVSGQVPATADVNAAFGDGRGIGKGNGDEEFSELIYTRDEAWIYAILATVLVGLTGIFPILLPIEMNPQSHDKQGAAKFNCILSFAVGGLLGDVFLHLLPEAWAHIAHDDHHGQTVVGLWVLVGMLVFLSLEKIFGEEEDDKMEKKEITRDITSYTNGINQSTNGGEAYLHTNGSTAGKHKTLQNGFSSTCHDNEFSVSKRRSLRNGTRHDHALEPARNGGGDHKKLANGRTGTSAKQDGTSEDHSEPHVQKKVKVVGYLNLLANFIDNFTHGIAVAGSFLVSRKVGFLTTAAIMLHEVPHEVGDFAILLRSGFTRVQAAKSQMSTALGGLLGAVVTLLSESAQETGDRSAWILPFTAGGFLYIALVTILPDLLQEVSSLKQAMKQMVCLLAGIGVMTAVSMVVE